MAKTAEEMCAHISDPQAYAYCLMSANGKLANEASSAALRAEIAKNTASITEALNNINVSSGDTGQLMKH